MADVPDPVPVEGWARERPLGHFSGSVEDIDEIIERHNAQEAAQSAAERRRAVVAVLLLAVGAVALLVSVTALLSWPWALLVFGMMTIIMGVMIGMGDSSTISKRGQ